MGLKATRKVFQRNIKQWKMNDSCVVKQEHLGVYNKHIMASIRYSLATVVDS